MQKTTNHTKALRANPSAVTPNRGPTLSFPNLQFQRVKMLPFMMVDFEKSIQSHTQRSHQTRGAWYADRRQVYAMHLALLLLVFSLLPPGHPIYLFYHQLLSLDRTKERSLMLLYFLVDLLFLKLTVARGSLLYLFFKFYRTRHPTGALLRNFLCIYG